MIYVLVLNSPNADKMSYLFLVGFADEVRCDIARTSQNVYCLETEPFFVTNQWCSVFYHLSSTTSSRALMTARACRAEKPSRSSNCANRSASKTGMAARIRDFCAWPSVRLRKYRRNTSSCACRQVCFWPGPFSKFADDQHDGCCFCSSQTPQTCSVQESQMQPTAIKA